MPEKTLKQKATVGVIWVAISKYSNMIISFISGIILARLLSPFDYGCIGMLVIFMALSEAFVDGGFGSALIQKKNPTQDDYSTIFFWNLGMSFVMYAILFFSAPAIARFYSIPILSSVLRVQGIILFIYALNIVQANQLRKRMDFKSLSIITIVTSVVSLCVTIWMAYSGCGVWSLVAQNILSAAIPCIAYWFIIKWRPTLVFSTRSFKELFGFGAYMFLTNLVHKFCAKMTGLLIGKVYSPQALGYYSKAQNTESMASSTISSIMAQVTYPLYSQIQDDLEAMRNMVKRITSSIAFLSFPLMFVLLLTAKPIFVLLYSEKWLSSVPYFQVLCLAGVAECLQSVNVNTIAAIGKSRQMFYWTIVKRVGGLSFVFGGLLIWGMKGLLVGMVIFTWFSYFVNISLVSKYVGYKWYRQIIDLFPIGLAALASAVISWGISYFCHLGLYLDGILKGVLCIGIYLGWAIVFKPQSYTFLLSIIPDKFKLW